jgi:hypothetical protein
MEGGATKRGPFQTRSGEYADVFITTTSEASGLTVPTEVPAHPTTQSLVGAIELSAEDNLLATATY